MKPATRRKFLLISTIPLWLFSFDLALDTVLAYWELHGVVHMALVGGSAIVLTVLLWVELAARDAAEETLKREHEELEVLVRQRAVEYARTLHHESSVLEAIMENTETMLAYLDTGMRFVRANTAYVKGSGHTREELIGHNHFELFPNPENEAIFVKARDTGEPVSFVAKPFEFPDQPWRGVTYWDWALVPTKDVAGAVSGFVFSLRDVTREHRAAKRQEEHLERLNALLAVTERTLREQTVETLFQSVADAAREVTDARVSVAGHGYRAGKFTVLASSRAEGVPPCPTDVPVAAEAGGVYHAIIESEQALRLTDEELHAHPRWHGLPPGHSPLRGLLGVRMNGSPASDVGIIMVSDKRVGDFSQEDEALLSELAALTSLSLQHIKARTDAEHSAMHLDAIFSAMTNPVIVFDAGGVAIRANPAALGLTGFDPVASTLDSIVTRLRVHDEEGHAIDLPEVPSSRALRGEVVVDKRLILHSVDGTEHIVRASSSPLWLGASQLGAVTVWADETDREHLHQQLETERATLKAIIDNAPAGIVVVDDQARIQLVNPAGERIGPVPLRPGESFGYHASYTFCAVDGTPYDPRELPLVRSALLGEVHRDVELQLQVSDGGHRHLLMSSTPIRDQAGRISEAVGILQDITLRRHNEERLKQGEYEYQLLMEQASDGIVVVDAGGKIQAANSRACELIGYERSEALLTDVLRFVVADDIASLAATMGRITADKGVIAEHRLRRKDGTVLHVETSARRLSDGRYQAIVRDVTERKTLEEEFARAVKAHVFDQLFTALREFQHGEVLAMNLHRLALFARNLRVFSGDATQVDDSARTRLESVVAEFRTITRQKLLGIASLVRTVERELTGEGTPTGEQVSGAEILSLTESLLADTEELAGLIRRRREEEAGADPQERGVRIAEHAETLARKIVAVTRQMNERFTASPVDVALAVAKACRAKWAGTRIDVTEGSRGLKALIRPAELAEVLSLLLGNARDALAGIGSPPAQGEKRITVRLQERDGRVLIGVEDSGTGVPPDIRGRIFERGFSTKGEGHGHGLGYALDHLSAYGGDLTFEEAANGGARFVISLVQI